MTRLIGRRCKDSNVLSQPVLIGRGLDLASLNTYTCPVQLSRCKRSLKLSPFPVRTAEGPHPFPFRTRPLSPPAPMVLLGRPSGRVGPCRKTFSVARGCLNLAQRRSPVAQWQSTRLLTEGLLVRVQPGEPDFKPPISAVFCFIAAPPGCSGGVVAFPGSMTFVLNRVSVRTHTLRPRCSSSIPRPTTKRLGVRAIRARCTRDPHHPHACFRFCLRGSSRLIVRFQACHRVLRDR